MLGHGEFMYPSSLSYNMLKVEITKQTYRLIPARTEGVRQNQTIEVSLPQNAINDLDSFFLSALATVTGTGGDTFAELPKYATIFSKIVVEVGGVALHSCSNVEQVSNILATLNCSDEERRRLAIYGEGGDRAAPLTAASAAGKRIIVDNFMGFIGSAKPRLIDSGLTNTIKLVFHLAGGETLAVNDATSSGYTLNDIYFGISTYAIADSDYYAVYDKQLQMGRNLVITYKNYFTNLSPVTGNNVSARFTVNTQSLDRVLAAYVQQTGTGALTGVDTVTKNSTYYTRDGSKVTGWNINLNNTQFPMWNAGKADSWPLMIEAFDHKHSWKGVDPNCKSAKDYEEKYWTAAYKFALPDSQKDHTNRLSGVNGITMGLQVVFNATGTSTVAQNLLLVAECTSWLEISGNRIVTTVA